MRVLYYMRCWFIKRRVVIGAGVCLESVMLMLCVCLRVRECDLQDLLPVCHDPDRCHIHGGPQVHPHRVLGPVLLHHRGLRH